MKYILCFFLSLSSLVHAQKKDITLEDIWTNDTFRSDYMSSLHSMNVAYYAVMEYPKSGVVINKYSYKTLQKTATIVDSKEIENVETFSSYEFNNDETKIILGTDFKQVYRHSYTATYYVYDLATKKATLIDAAIQEPTFSPDSKKVAYAKDNNIFVKDLQNNTTTQITSDGVKNEIINGTTDWVYEEEFAFVRAFQWNKNSSYIAYLRFDERAVPEFSMDLYGKDLYPSQQVFKYPKAGETNATVTLHLYKLSEKSTEEIAVGDYEYIPRIQWTSEANTLSVTTLNRHQNNLNLFFVNAASATATVILQETDAAYIDIQDNLTFLENNSFIWTSEKDGYNHLYLYTKKGQLKRQLTKGNWDVTQYYGFDAKRKRIYYQSVESGSINRGVYSVNIYGKRKKSLSTSIGTNRASFSKNRQYFINTFSDSNTPPVYSLHSADGQLLQTIKDNQALQNTLAQYTISKKEFSTIHINGNDLNMWLLKPANFDPSKTYPLLMYQYSGPGSQSVKNSWNSSNDYWYQMLAQQGYLIACVDGRGTGYKGRDFKKVTYKELGKFEVEDQISAAKKLAQLPYVDAANIGIWGWSYGGFMSSNCLLKGSDVFSTAIAVAPVTSWRFYDSVYTERYMQTPQENASGYDENSPINHADKLQGNYLLVHGTGDDNVHVQNTMRMVNALVAANKPFDFFIYPDRTHGIYKGKNTRLHLYTKMTAFIQQHLKTNN